MNTLLKTVMLTTTLFAAGSALAGEQTVTLAVKNMTCASCPYIAKQSLATAAGVSAATANNGFPSEVLG